ncbi:MAG TPA: cell division protein ZapB [Bacteroidaceae bacterium]|jgi:predicted RNase H-like nuclease (RuvC/YqgF family)|nr:cell division protein ZapB [Bacteroidales bacterium]HPX99200.1 cell division protein ZapB [Bacteroidaceae bacterium]
MTDNDSILIEQFESKIRKLIELYENIKCRNSQLQEELEAKDEEIKHLTAQMSSLQESYLNLKQSKVLAVSGHDIDATKRRISGLMREIDHCIELLNN